MTTVYITKYALSTGIIEREAEISSSGSMASWKDHGYFNKNAHGKEFWLTKEEAVADCERRRKAKLASIDKQRARIEKMEFKL